MERVARQGPPWAKWWLLGLALLLATQISSYWYPTPDACSYLSMARSLAHGQGLRNLGSPHLWYPPGYAILISPLFFLSDRPFLALSLFQWAQAVLFMLGVYVWARRNVPEAPLLITALSVVNAIFWLHLRRTLTEVTFMALFIWTVNSLQAALAANTSRSTAWRSLAAVMLMVMLCLVRQAGITLAAGFGVYALLSARLGKCSWRKAILLAAVVGISASACVAVLIVREQLTSQLTGRRTYLNNFGDSARQWEESCLQGLQMCVSEAGRASLPGMFKCYGRPGQWLNINMAIYLPFFLVMLWGCWRWQRRSLDLFVCALPFYIALHAAYAIDSGARFAAPLVPLMVVSIWFALERVSLPVRIRLFALALVLHLATAAGYWLRNDLPQARSEAAQWPVIDTFAVSIQTKPGPMAVLGLSVEIRKMLDLAVDRRSIENVDSDRLDPEIRWLMTRHGQPIPAGFVLHSTAGNYQLLQRSP